jgi:hypothetical protein
LIFSASIFLTCEKLYVDSIGVFGIEYFGNFFNKGNGQTDFLEFAVIKEDFPYLWINYHLQKQVKKINVKSGFKDNLFSIEKTYGYKKITNPFNVFYDIDFFNGSLYTNEYHTDTFCRYDIGNIIKQLI